MTLRLSLMDSVYEKAALLPFSFELSQQMWAWAQWQKYSCVERHNGHLWEATCEGYFENASFPDEYKLDVMCGYCGYSLGDDIEDYHYFMSGEVNGIPVHEGHCLSLLPFTVQVYVDVEYVKYTSWDSIYPEYDIYIHVGDR